MGQRGDQDGGGPRTNEDQEHLRALQRARQVRVLKTAAVLLIVVILMIFIVRNSQGVPVDFVFFSANPGLIWVMLACAVLGAVAGYLVGRPDRETRLHRRRGDADEPGR